MQLVASMQIASWPERHLPGTDGALAFTTFASTARICWGTKGLMKPGKTFKAESRVLLIIRKKQSYFPFYCSSCHVLLRWCSLLEVVFWESVAKVKLHSLCCLQRLWCVIGSHICVKIPCLGYASATQLHAPSNEVRAGPPSPGHPATACPTPVLPSAWRFIPHAWWQDVLPLGDLSLCSIHLICFSCHKSISFICLEDSPG